MKGKLKLCPRINGWPHGAQQAAESVLECFRRAVRQAIELLDLECRARYRTTGT